MNRPVRFAILAALIFGALLLSFTSATETPATCTTDTDCMERFGGDGGPDPARNDSSSAEAIRPAAKTPEAE